MALRARRSGGEPKPPYAASVKSRGRERYGKGPQPAGQVSGEKTNVCEPLLTHRNSQGWHQNWGCVGTPRTKTRRFASSVRKRPVCCPGGARCTGGVSSSQALAWNRRTCRSDTDGQLQWVRVGPLAARGRVPSGGHREGQSTDAEHRGGPARSSDDGLVMGPERRCRASQIDQRSTRTGRSRWTDQVRR